MISLRRKIGWLAICASFSLAIVLVLQLISRQRINTTGQHFLRNYINIGQSPVSTVELGNAEYYFAGTDSSHIYLGNYQAANRLAGFNNHLTDSSMIVLSIPNSDPPSSANQTIDIEDGKLSILERESGKIYQSNLLRPVKPVLKEDLNGFIFDALVFEDTSIVKKYDSVSKRNIFCSYDRRGKLIHCNPDVLQSSAEGIISSDGTLMFNSLTQLIYYVYFYRNQILCFDKSLRIKYRKSTIDTTSQAKISLHYVHSGDYTTFDAPPSFVNKTSCSAGSWIYIYSTMVARNDAPKKRNQSSVIDMYSSKDGEYHASFYLPDFLGNKVRSMLVNSNQLFVLQGNYLCGYSLSE
jgi:hypothetical protein